MSLLEEFFPLTSSLMSLSIHRGGVCDTCISDIGAILSKAESSMCSRAYHLILIILYINIAVYVDM